MDKKRILIKDITKADPFKTPEGYFENFTKDIMSQLPEIEQEEPKNLSLWQRVRPWIYMAAMFVGIALMIKVFTSSPRHLGIKNYASEGFNLTSSSDIEDFYNYYDDRLARLVYDDAFYLNNFTTEDDLN